MNATATGSPAAHKQLCTFRVDGMLFGIDVRDVQEVICHQRMTQVPLAPRLIGGLINLRGQIVTALHLRERLGLPPEAADAEHMNVVVRRPEGVVSLIVDEIGDVVDVDESAFEPPPATMPASARDLVLGAYKLSDGLLIFLDTALATQTDRAPAAALTAFGDH